MAILGGRRPYTRPRNRQQVQQALRALRRGNEFSNEAEITYNGAVKIGQPVYLDAAGEGFLARANAASTAIVKGLAAATIGAGGSGGLIGFGYLTLDDWTDVAGTTSLAEESVYFLSPTTAGIITTTKPTTTGQLIVPVGKPVSSTTLNIVLGPITLL